MSNPLLTASKRDPQNGQFLMDDGEVFNVVLKGGFRNLTELQAAIHEGSSYGFNTDETGSIAANGTLYLRGKTGAKQIHFDAIGGLFERGGFIMELFEGATFSADGTLQTPYNLNRAFADDSTLELYTAPTVTDEGTRIGGTFFPLTGSGANISPASGAIAGGRVLKENTEYLFKILNTENSALGFGVSFIWHEPIYTLGV